MVTPIGSDSLDELDEDQEPQKIGKVLVAEDIKTNRLVLTSLLATLEIDVVEAKDGSEALAVFKNDPTINFILMDVQMPVMDGVAATINIREWEEIKKLDPTPIIAVTAFDYAEDIKRCMDAGMNDVMYKPADLKKLAKIVEGYLHTKQIDHHQKVANVSDVLAMQIVEDESKEVFSQEWLQTFVADHKKLASVLLHEVMTTVPEYFQLLKDAIESKAWHQCQAILHILKTQFRLVGAIRLTHAGSELQGILKNGGTLNQVIYESLLKQYQALENDLNAWLRANV